MGEDVIFLARAPGQVADQGAPSGAVVIRGAKSGNAKFDPATGRFAGGKAKDPVQQTVPDNPVVVNRSGIPQGVQQEEWERRMDTVRDAARNATVGDDNAVKFLEGRVNDLSKIDVAQFIKDVRAQQVDDLTDIFATQLPGFGAKRKTARMAAPSKWITKVFSALEDEEVTRLVRRLIARGYKKEDVINTVLGKISDETRRERLESSIG